MKPLLVAHRGEPVTWPENSLTGYRAVLEAGARYVETDVQITADGIPVLSHDPSLLKITGRNLHIPETDYRSIRACSAGYPERFGEQYRNLQITRLDEFAELLQQWPGAQAFVEIKHASVKAFGTARVVDTILHTLENVIDQCILISFEYEAMVYARTRSPIPIGWVLPEWTAENRRRASELGPDFLFCNHKRLPAWPEPLWQGPWKWVIYTVNDAAGVVALMERGAEMIETNVIRQLLADPGLAGPASG